MSRKTSPGALGVVCALAALLFAAPAHAHKPSDSYLTLSVAGGAVTGRWDIALRDLDRALVLDRDGDGALTWGEIHAREDELVRHALAALSLARSQPCPLTSAPLELVEHSDGRYARLALRGACPPAPAPLTLDYSLLFALDPQHRAIVELGDDPAHARTFVLGASAHTLTVPEHTADAGASFRALVVEGITHILSGLDHVLFLLALILPAMLRQGRPALREVVSVVTAFTIAHSLSLALAALGVVDLSAAIIEPAIAASVALAAVDNLWPVLGGGRHRAALALGLLHGFGFASALADLGSSGAALVRALFAFNLGVELGQLALLVPVVLLALCVRRLASLRRPLLQGGSVVIAAVSLVWLYERVMGG